MKWWKSKVFCSKIIHLVSKKWKKKTSFIQKREDNFSNTLINNDYYNKIRSFVIIVKLQF